MMLEVVRLLEVVRPLEAVPKFCPALQLNLYGMGGNDASRALSPDYLLSFFSIHPTI